MMWLALWLYAIGCALVALNAIVDEDPWYIRVLAIFGWPIIFPLAMIGGIGGLWR